MSDLIRTWGGQWQISIEGGRTPIWSPDGKELFFRGQGKVMAVGIESEPSFSAGTPGSLFEDIYYDDIGRHYDISPDGRRFLMIKNAGTPHGASARTEIIVVENWFEELKRLAPPGKVGQ